MRIVVVDLPNCRPGTPACRCTSATCAHITRLVDVAEALKYDFSMTIDDYINWDLYGVCDDAERTFGTAEWIVPSDIWVGENLINDIWLLGDSPDDDKVRLEDALCWRELDESLQPRRLVRPGIGMLNGFLALGNGTPAEIERYAKQWGPLRLCEHNAPATHAEQVGPPVYPFGRLSCAIRQGTDERGGLYHYEPISAWRDYARQAQGLLLVADALRDGKLGDTAHWRLVSEGLPNVLPQDLDRRRWHVARRLSIWIQAGGVRPGITWSGSTPRLEFGRCGLYGALGIQLLLAIGRTKSFAWCSSCGKLYLPNRAPDPGRNHYCPDCGRDAAVRDAQRRRREKKKAQRESSKENSAS